MKISNASKKVLASALSAAMVVAFAPTVAFGAVAGDEITVTYDYGTNAKAVDGAQAPADKTVKVTNAGELTLAADAAAASAYKLAGIYSVSGWWFDADADGVVDKDETLSAEAAGTLKNIKDEVTNGSTIKLVAQYAAPAIASSDITVAQGTPAAAADFATFKVSNTAATDQTVTLTLAKDGKAIGTKQASATHGAATATTDFNFTFVADDAAATPGAGQVKVGDYGTGKYTATLTDAAGNVLSSKDFEITALSLTNGQFGATNPVSNLTVNALVGATYAAALEDVADVVPTYPSDDATKPAFEGYSVDGKSVATYAAAGTPTKWTAVNDENGKPYEVTAGAQLTAVYAEARLGTTSYSGKTISTIVEHPAADVDYSAKVTVPGGATYDMVKGAGNDFSFAVSGSADPALGDYVVTVFAKKDNKTDEFATKTVKLVKVTYSAGEGEFTKSGTTSNKPADVIDAVGNTVNLAAGTVVKAPEKKAFSKWQIDGKDYDASKTGVKITAGSDNVLTVTATYKATNAVDAPTFAYADGYLTLSQNAGDKFEIKYGTSSSSLTSTYNAAGKGIAISDPSKASTYYAQVVAKASATGVNSSYNSEVIAIVPSKDAVSTFKAWADGILAKATINDSAKAHEYYKDVLKTASVDGQNALKALNFQKAEAAKVANAWDEAVYAQKKVVIDAVVAYDSKLLDAYKAGVEQKDGSVKKISSEVYAKAQAKIAAAVADWNAINDTDDKTVAATGSTVSTDDTFFTAYKKAITDAVADATSYKAADVAVAKAVNDAIAALPAEVTAANAKDAKAAAEKVVADFAALNADAKSLVSSTDYAKAVETIEAADAAIKAADKAAIAKVKGKTVKAKAKKVTKSSLKVVTSKSGAKSTFKKVTKNSKVTVSKSGKIVVKKGLKAGKKYTVKVKATVGASTKTVKVVVKVAK